MLVLALVLALAVASLLRADTQARAHGEHSAQQGAPAEVTLHTGPRQHTRTRRAAASDDHGRGSGAPTPAVLAAAPPLRAPAPWAAIAANAGPGERTGAALRPGQPTRGPPTG